MKASDLRIGNWVLCNDQPCKVICLNEDEIICIGEDRVEEEIKPIPLTPEILEKAGFENKNDNFYTIQNVISFGIQPDGLYPTFIKGDNVINQVKFLHQLQNLYHALTGEDLPVTFSFILI